jgi:hypothetical protein
MSYLFLPISIDKWHNSTYNSENLLLLLPKGMGARNILFRRVCTNEAKNTICTGLWRHKPGTYRHYISIPAHQLLSSLLLLFHTQPELLSSSLVSTQATYYITSVWLYGYRLSTCKSAMFPTNRSSIRVLCPVLKEKREV